jgi:hypothetical protein
VLFFPWSLKSLSSSSDGYIDIFIGAFVNGTDDFFGARIDHLEGLSIDSFHPFIVDEQSCGLSIFSTGGSLELY